MSHKRRTGKIHCSVYYSPPLDTVLSHVLLCFVLSISILPPHLRHDSVKYSAFLISAMRAKCPGKDLPHSVAYPGILFGGVQQIQLRTEGRENGNLGTVAP
jgi:hypothetical protein